MPEGKIAFAAKKEQAAIIIKMTYNNTHLWLVSPDRLL